MNLLHQGMNLSFHCTPSLLFGHMIANEKMFSIYPFLHCGNFWLEGERKSACQGLVTQDSASHYCLASCVQSCAVLHKFKGAAYEI